MRERLNAFDNMKGHPPLLARLASSEGEVLAAQRLRYQVFVEEMGAKLSGATDGIEHDPYDPFCQHLIVVNSIDDQVIATTRLLTEENARHAGGFYSAKEFDLTAVTQLSGNLLEVGRTCVHRDHRTGKTLAALWSGLAARVTTQQVNYLFGCASIPIENGQHSPKTILDALGPRFLSPWQLRSTPRYPLLASSQPSRAELDIPALVKTYLRLGAWVCGEPCWDEEFKVADVFILLDMKRLNAIYADRLLKMTRFDYGSERAVA